MQSHTHLLHSSSSDVFPILVSGPAGVGKKTIVMATSRRLNLQVVKVDCYEICGDTTAATEARMRNSFHKGGYKKGIITSLHSHIKHFTGPHIF